MQMLLNPRAQWLNNYAKIPVNGEVYVYADASSTTLVKLYSDVGLQNEIQNPQILDTSGRLRQSVFFAEDSVHVQAFEELNGVKQLMFAFDLEGGKLLHGGAGTNIIGLDDLINSDIMGDCLIYHAKKLKYLKWVDDILIPNGVTIWLNAEGTGSWIWETTVLDIWDIGIMDDGALYDPIAFNTASQLAPATFIVRQGRYSFSGGGDVNWQGIHVIVENGADFHYVADSSRLTWTVNKQPTINAKLAYLTWNATIACDFRASLIDALADGAQVNKFYADDNCALNFSPTETIGSLNIFGEPNKISVATGYNAGRLIGPMAFSSGKFREGAISQMASKSASLYDCTGTFTIDEEWNMTQSAVTINCDVIVNAAWRSLSLQGTSVQVGTIIRARQSSISADMTDGSPHYPLIFSVNDFSVLLDGFGFADNYVGRVSASYYINAVNSATPNDLVVKNFTLDPNISQMSGCTYESCTLVGTGGTGSPYGIIFNGGYRLTYKNCEFITDGSGGYISIQSYKGQTNSNTLHHYFDLLEFENCDFSRVSNFLFASGLGTGIDFMQVSFKNCVASNIQVNISLAAAAYNGAILNFKNFVDLGKNFVYSDEDPIDLSGFTLEADEGSGIYRILLAAPTARRFRPFPYRGPSSQTEAIGMARSWVPGGSTSFGQVLTYTHRTGNILEMRVKMDNGIYTGRGVAFARFAPTYA